MACTVALAVALAACERAAQAPDDDGNGPGNGAAGGTGGGGSGGARTTGPGTGGVSGNAGSGGAPAKSADGGGAGGGAGGAGSTGSDDGGSAPDAAGNSVDAPARDARLVDSRPSSSSQDAPSPPVIGGPAPPCKHTFCESFENYTVGAAPDRAIWPGRSSRIVVDATRAARGTKALRVPMVVSGEHFIRTTKPFPALGSSLYGRMFFWIDQQPLQKPATVYHWTLMEASERTEGAGKVLRYGGIMSAPETNPFFFNIETHGMGETGRTDQRPSPAPRVWHCIEWQFTRAGNQARFWWNGQERRALSWPDPASNEPKYTDPKYFFPEMKSISFGWAEYQAVDTAWDIWIDEIVLHTEKIGCE